MTGQTEQEAFESDHLDEFGDEDAQTRSKSKRKRRFAIAGAVIAGLAVCGIALPFTPLMPVKGVVVDGNDVLTPEAVQAQSDIELGTPMGLVKVRRAAENIVQDPWVDVVTVHRDWPSTVRVDLKERVAVAYLQQPDGAHLIDTEGKDFLIAEPPVGAMELVGVDVENKEQMRDAVAIAASISSGARAQVAALEANGRYSFVLRLHDNRRVVWGASEDNANKSLAFETVLQREGAEFNISNPELITAR